MATKIGVGFSENPKSYEAGVDLAKTAMEDASILECDLAMLYSTSKHDPVKLRDGVRSVIGSKAKIIGGYSIGIIIKDKLGYEGYQAGLAVWSSDTVKIDMFMEKGLPDNEYRVGTALGSQIKKRSFAGEPNFLLMYDSVKDKPSEGVVFNFNLATPLVQGMEKSLESWPPAAGVGMLGDWQCNPGYQWFNDQIEQNTAMVLSFSGDIRMDTIIMHGCKPSSGYHTITRAEGNVVLGIDGKRAVDMVAEILGDTFKSWEDYPFFVTLGVNKGDKYEKFDEEKYANRLVMGIDKDRGGLIMFEPDLKAGMEFQFMQRSIDFEYMRHRSEDILKRIGNRTPVFAFYIDCAGRACAYCGSEGEEAEEIQKVIGSRMPLLGMYSGVEIAKVGSDMQPLDWTGVLCIFSE